MAKRSRVELFEQIRKVHEREDVSIRELARRFRVHGCTVREALVSAVPPARNDHRGRLVDVTVSDLELTASPGQGGDITRPAAPTPGTRAPGSAPGSFVASSVGLRPLASAAGGPNVAGWTSLGASSG